MHPEWRQEHLQVPHQAPFKTHLFPDTLNKRLCQWHPSDPCPPGRRTVSTCCDSNPNSSIQLSHRVHAATGSIPGHRRVPVSWCRNTYHMQPHGISGFENHEQSAGLCSSSRSREDRSLRTRSRESGTFLRSAYTPQCISSKGLMISTWGLSKSRALGGCWRIREFGGHFGIAVPTVQASVRVWHLLKDCSIQERRVECYPLDNKFVASKSDEVKSASTRTGRPTKDD